MIKGFLLMGYQGCSVLRPLIMFTYNEKLSNANSLFIFNFHNSRSTVNKCMY